MNWNFDFVIPADEVIDFFDKNSGINDVVCSSGTTGEPLIVGSPLPTWNQPSTNVFQGLELQILRWLHAMVLHPAQTQR